MCVCVCMCVCLCMCLRVCVRACVCELVLCSCVSVHAYINNMWIALCHAVFCYAALCPTLDPGRVPVPGVEGSEPLGEVMGDIPGDIPNWSHNVACSTASASRAGSDWAKGHAFTEESRECPGRCGALVPCDPTPGERLREGFEELCSDRVSRASRMLGLSPKRLASGPNRPDSGRDLPPSSDIALPP